MNVIIKTGCNWLLGSLEMYSSKSVLIQYDAHIYFYTNLIHKSSSVKSKTLWALANMVGSDEVTFATLVKSNVLYRVYYALNDTFKSDNTGLSMIEIWQHVSLLNCNLAKYSNNYIFNQNDQLLFVYLYMEAFGKCLTALVDVKKAKIINHHHQSSSIISKKERIVNTTIFNIFVGIRHISCNHNYLMSNLMSRFEAGGGVFFKQFSRGLLHEASTIRLAALDAMNHVCNGNAECIDKLIAFGLLQVISDWYCGIEMTQDEIMKVLQLLIIIIRLSNANKKLIAEKESIMHFICICLASNRSNICINALYYMNLCISTLEPAILKAIYYYDNGKYLANFCDLLGRYNDIKSELRTNEKHEFMNTFKNLALPCQLSLIPHQWVIDKLLQNGFMYNCKEMRVINEEQGVEESIFYIEYLYSKCEKLMTSNDTK